MPYLHGHFVWYALITPAVDAALAFYPEVVGWGVQGMDMGDSVYHMVTTNGAPQAGVVEPQMPGVPPHWAGYISVDDVDAAAGRAAEHGGRVLVPPTDIPVGRFALIADPQGATVFLFRGAEGDTASQAFHWTELWAKDAAAVLDFYTAVFGWELGEMAMPDGGTYHLFKVGERMVAGAMTSPIAEAPPMWLAWASVDDVDATVARATANGGSVKQAPSDVPGIGRMAIVADTSGAVLGVITPAQS